MAAQAHDQAHQIDGRIDQRFVADEQPGAGPLPDHVEEKAAQPHDEQTRKIRIGQQQTAERARGEADGQCEQRGGAGHEKCPCRHDHRLAPRIRFIVVQPDERGLHAVRQQADQEREADVDHADNGVAGSAQEVRVERQHDERDHPRQDGGTAVDGGVLQCAQVTGHCPPGTSAWLGRTGNGRAAASASLRTPC